MLDINACAKPTKTNGNIEQQKVFMGLPILNAIIAVTQFSLH